MVRGRVISKSAPAIAASGHIISQHINCVGARLKRTTNCSQEGSKRRLISCVDNTHRSKEGSEEGENILRREYTEEYIEQPSHDTGYRRQESREYTEEYIEQPSQDTGDRRAMKTASLGLLEVKPFPLSLFSSRKFFGEQADRGFATSLL